MPPAPSSTTAKASDAQALRLPETANPEVGKSGFGVVCHHLADSYAFLAISTSCLKPSGSRMAISLIILRFRITPAFVRPAMNWL